MSAFKFARLLPFIKFSLSFCFKVSFLPKISVIYLKRGKRDHFKQGESCKMRFTAYKPPEWNSSGLDFFLHLHWIQLWKLWILIRSEKYRTLILKWDIFLRNTHFGFNSHGNDSAVLLQRYRCFWPGDSILGFTKYQSLLRKQTSEYENRFCRIINFFPCFRTLVNEFRNNFLICTRVNSYPVVYPCKISETVKWRQRYRYADNRHSLEWKYSCSTCNCPGIARSTAEDYTTTNLQSQGSVWPPISVSFAQTGSWTPYFPRHAIFIFKVCLHILMGRLDLASILPIKGTVTSDTILNLGQTRWRWRYL